MTAKLSDSYLWEARQLFGKDFPDYLDSFKEESTPSLRINTTKISVEEFLKIAPFKLESVPWTDNGFYYDPEDRPALHPYYYAGLYYLQEASAMVPAAFLPVEEGDKVLDCCAAPGGKATELLNKLKNSGSLIANDISATRAATLLHNVESWGCENYAVTAEDLRKLAQRWPLTFERILLDAPCSGQGMFRKDPALIRSYNEKDSKAYVPLQQELLDCALGMLKGGGTLLYSTCTFSICENESVIAYALEKHPDVHLLPLPKYPGFMPGRNGMEECVRLYPHKLRGEGHFAALLEKTEENAPRPEKPGKQAEIPDVLKTFRHPFTNGSFRRIGEKLYFLPEELEGLEKLRVLRSGLLIGEYNKDRFEYAHSFALALKKEEFDNVLDLSANDIRTLKYLKGETIEAEEDLKDGLVLVCVDSYPLGFAQNKNGTLKNKYPKERRMR